MYTKQSDKHTNNNRGHLGEPCLFVYILVSVCVVLCCSSDQLAGTHRRTQSPTRCKPKLADHSCLDHGLHAAKNKIAAHNTGVVFLANCMLTSEICWAHRAPHMFG